MRNRALIFAVLLGLTFSVQAQDAGTLKKIRDTGVITLGYREWSIPFSYYDDRRQVVGYSIEFALNVVQAIRRLPGMNPLSVRFVPVTSQTRITLVQNGTVDLECGSTTNNVEREQQVAFSDSIFLIGTRLLTRRHSGIHEFADLQGRTVVTTAGTTSERLLRHMNAERDMRMKVISEKDHGQAFMTLAGGRAAAFMMDDALLAGERVRATRPSDFVITGTPQSHEAYGCMMRKGDPSFRKLVDDTITHLETSGEAMKIYVRWFQSPIPPRGLNLDFPPDPGISALFAHPSDRPLE